MKETGLMFKAPLVRAILSGQKTQTRRILKNQQTYDLDNCPFGQPGDRIYVRETFARVPTVCGSDELVFAADYKDGSDKAAGLKYTPAIHMPKDDARIWLEVTGVRVERLRDICEGDADREGVELKDGSDEPYSDTNRDGFRYRNYQSKEGAFDCGSARESFRTLWESTGGDWAANPWTWVIDFKRIDQPALKEAP